MQMNNLVKRVNQNEVRTNLSKEDLIEIISQLERELKVYQSLYKRAKSRLDDKQGWCATS